MKSICQTFTYYLQEKIQLHKGLLALWIIEWEKLMILNGHYTCSPRHLFKCEANTVVI